MILDFVKLVNGSSLSLPAHGRAGARTTSSLAALFAKQKTKFGGGTPVVERFAFTTGQEARAGKNFYPVGSRSDSFGAFPPTSFLFARPSENYQNSASGFSLKKVRILSKKDSHQKIARKAIFLMAGGVGIEPTFRVPETRCRPLADPPKKINIV